KRPTPVLVLLLLATLALASGAAAQTATVWMPKFVCGYETGNVPLLNDPNPPLGGNSYEGFKPGNYATTINIANASLAPQTVLLSAVLTTGVASAPSVTGNLTPVPVNPIGGTVGTVFRIDCTDIFGALQPFFPAVPPPAPGELIEGYLLIATATGGPGLQVDTVYTYSSQNAFERHVLWGTDVFGRTGVVKQFQGRTLSGILGPIGLGGPVGEELQDIAASGAGGLGLGASIDVERCEPTVVDLAGGGVPALLDAFDAKR
ncbi:MAG: hypothetical protein AAGD06_15405, partial [Acidobacteriota bacterium]